MSYHVVRAIKRHNLDKVVLTMERLGLRALNRNGRIAWNPQTLLGHLPKVDLMRLERALNPSRHYR